MREQAKVDPVLRPRELKGNTLARKRQAYAEWMGIRPVRLSRVFPGEFLEQLDRCADSAARRILIRARMEVGARRHANRGSAERPVA